ncbi:MAG: hypothetical protein WCK43_07605, partial [bacterium]
NVLCKVPKTQKKPVVDHMRSIFYAESRPKALEFFSNFKNSYEESIPSAVRWYIVLLPRRQIRVQLTPFENAGYQVA